MSTLTIQERAELVIAGKLKYAELDIQPTDLFELSNDTLDALNKVFYEESKEEPKPVSRPCAHCGGNLVSIGTDRKNGSKRHSDWTSRKYHKKCMKYAT